MHGVSLDCVIVLVQPCRRRTRGGPRQRAYPTKPHPVRRDDADEGGGATHCMKGNLSMKSHLPIVVWALVSLGAVPTHAAAAPQITLDQVIGAPISSAPIASPTGAKFAWTVNQRGRRNIWVAEPSSAGYVSRQVTSYTEDDGLELGELSWTPDAGTVVYTRGGTLRGGFLGIDRTPNVASAPQGPAPQEILALNLASGEVRRLADGRGAIVSPKGDLAAYLSGGQIWVVDIVGKAAPRRLIHDMGSPGGQVPGLPPAMTWSPDGRRLAFVSQRGDHSFVGSYDVESASITWLAPSVDTDAQPIWSPDSRRVAFIRLPGGGGFPQPRVGRPWSLVVADASTGKGNAVWVADAGVGSMFPSADAPNSRPAILWGAGDQLVFPWEKTGWTHLYAVPATGGDARALTSGSFEVANAELSPDRRTVIYASNQDDPDRRHIWKVAVAGGAPTRLDRGRDVEDLATMASDGASIAALQGGGVDPLQPVILHTSGSPTSLMPRQTRADYPAASLRAPEAVTFEAEDGLLLHGQLFLPPAGAKKAQGPALLFFHGGPRKQALLGWGNEAHNYANNLYLASQGYVVLSVNYRGSTGYGLEFRSPESFGPTGASEVKDVRAGALFLAARTDVDKTRIGSWGHSYGGMLTAQGLARHSDLIAAGVDYAGLTNWRSLFVKAGLVNSADAAVGAALTASSPVGAIDSWKSPVMLIYADDDRATPFSQMVELAAALRRKNVDFEQMVLPNETHNPQMYRSTLEIYSTINTFLGRRLAGPEAP